MTTIGIAAAAALLTLGPAPSSGEGPAPSRAEAPTLTEQQASRPAPQLDPNNDGTITRDEWTLSPELFGEADRNSDGVVSLDELAEWRTRASLGRQRLKARARVRALAGARALDRARARTLDRADRAWARALDRARARWDGVFNRARARALRSRRALQGHIARWRALDIDSNGVISRNEWRRRQEVFDRLDRNRDGQLSGDELQRPRPRLRPLR